MGRLLGVDGGNRQALLEENCERCTLTIDELSTVMIEIKSTLNN